MHQYEKDQNNFFSQRFKKHGNSQKALSWESPYTQQARFVELLKIYTLCDVIGHTTLLDFGCGLGHLYKWAKGNGFLSAWNIDYFGTDINTEFIRENHANFPETEFFLKDDSLYNKNFDIIVCSGLYNLKFSDDFDIAAHYKAELKQLFDICGRGIAVNFQSVNAIPLIPEHIRKTETGRFFFHDRDKVMKDLEQITGDLHYIEGYLPNDFTIYLLK